MPITLRSDTPRQCLLSAFVCVGFAVIAIPMSLDAIRRHQYGTVLVALFGTPCLLVVAVWYIRRARILANAKSSPTNPGSTLQGDGPEEISQPPNRH
jgi:hypothetical protein